MSIYILIPAGVIAGFLLHYLYVRVRLSLAQKDARRIVEEASREAETRKKEGALEIKEEMHKARLNFESETKSRKGELKTLEKRLLAKEEGIDDGESRDNRKDRRGSYPTSIRATRRKSGGGRSQHRKRK